MTQKIIQIGNSTGIIIPKALLDKIGLTSGSEVDIEENSITKSLSISKKGQKSISITPDFLSILDRVNKHYGPALKELANR